jgi:hypothetical protein
MPHEKLKIFVTTKKYADFEHATGYCKWEIIVVYSSNPRRVGI